MKTTMRTKAALAALFFGLVLAAPAALADQLGIDYPHYQPSGVGCDSCHYIAEEPPAWVSHVAQDIDDTPSNNLCWSCHNDVRAQFVEPHSALTTSTRYGTTWSVECRTCHWPHHQLQPRTYGAASHVAAGSSTALTANSLSLAGAGWIPNSFAGYLLIPNTSQLSYSYRITTSTSDTVWVEPAMDLSKAAVGNPFAIVYGKLVKNSLATPNSGTKTVRLFRREGPNSFADGDATYDGVCEVCHTQPSHFRNNGAAPDQLHNNLNGWQGGNCILCHTHANGFGHGPDGGGTACADCHGKDQDQGGKGSFQSHSTHTETDADDLKGAGGLLCNACHDTTDYPFFKSGTDISGDGRLSLAETDVCDTCHSPGGAYDGVNAPASGAKANWKNGIYAGLGLRPGKETWCLGCHDDLPANSRQDGSGIVAPNKAGDGLTYGYFLTGHGRTTPFNATLHGQNGPGYACAVCHETTASHLNHTAGDRRLMAVPGDGLASTSAATEVCQDCHQVGQSANGALGFDASAEATIHSGAITGKYNTNAAAAFPAYGNSADYATSPGYQCEDCHDVHGTGKLAMLLPVIDGRLAGASNPVAITGLGSADSDLLDLDPAAGPDNGVCDACHQAGNDPHPDTSHAGNHYQGETGNACMACHTHTRSFAHGGGAGMSCGTANSCHGTFDSHPTHVKDSAMVLVDCDACHNTGSFPTFADGQTLAGTSVCAGCHGGGSALAKTYWQSPGSEAMAAGSWLAVEGDANYCGTCHGGNESADHNNLNASAGCSSCHQPLGTKVEMLALHNGAACSTCHLSADVAVTATISTGKSGGGNTAVQCTSCHTGPGGNAMHGLATIDAELQARHNMLSVSANAGSDPADCAICHTMGSAQARLDLHPGCLACHTSADPDVVAAISGGIAGSTINCETCHDAQGENRLHGLTIAAVAGDHTGFGTSHTGESACGNCHLMATASDSLDLHPACSSCHTTHATDATLRTAVVNDGREPGHQVGGGNGNAQDCESCHSTLGQYRLHGLTVADVAGDHTAFTTSHSAEKACSNCHTMASSSQSLDLHPSCTTCHTTHATDGSGRTTAINNGREAGHHVGGGNNVTQSCESCHSAKGTYSLHGLTDDNGADGVADAHDQLVTSQGAWVSTGNQVPAYRKADYSGKIKYGVYGGLLAPDYNCADCHAADRATITTLEAVQLHTRANGTGFGDCRTCHTASGIRNEVDNGREPGHHIGGGGNQAVSCETCHQAAYDAASPSGQKMYQYDGVRHHTTAYAQAGDCTYCHADPRPATPTQATGYAATADTVGTSSTGWNTDYALGYADANVPKQPACRLCHTNAMTYSVNVDGGNGNHGFNIGGPTNGLTVYANDFNATTTSFINTSTRPVNATKMTQTGLASHRIAANDGATLIQVENMGACFTCHSVQIMHAAPKPGADYPAPGCGQYAPLDSLRYAPGRSVFNLLKGSATGNTTSWDDHRYSSNSLQPYDPCSDTNSTRTRAKNYLKNNNGNDWQWGDVAGDSLLGVPASSSFSNFEGLSGMPTNGATYNVPVFANIAAPAIPDNIHITRAYYQAGALTVEAYSEKGAGQTLSFTYTGGGCNGTAMTWNGSFYAGTCNSPSGWTEGVDTVTASNTATASPLDVETRLVTGFKAAAAVADSLTAWSGLTTSLAPLANDTGTGIYLLAIDAAGLNANCTAEMSGNQVALTCGAATGAMGSFGYTIKDAGGGQSSATITVTAAVNSAPTLAIAEPDGVNDQVFAGDLYPITYTLDDPDETVTVAFYRDNDHAGENGTALPGACAAAAEGSGVTCAWDTTGLAPGTYYVYGQVSDGYHPAVSAYSAGALTVVAPVSVAGPASALATAGGGTNTATASYAAAAGSNRIVLIAVAWEDTTSSYDTNETVTSGTYGGQAISQVAVTRSSDGRQGVWVGYVTAAKLAAKSGDAISLSFDGDGNNPNVAAITAMTLANASQAAPAAVTANGTSGTALAWSGLAVNAGGYAVYLANADGAVTFDPPPPGGSNDFTERFDTQIGSQFQLTAGDKAITSTGTSAETVTSSLSGRWALTAVAVQSNANFAPSLAISQPDGAGDAVYPGSSYNITYSLEDGEDVVTAAFSYDVDNTGLDGVAITGACATAAEGTDATCAWDTTGLAPGTYYVYGASDDGINPAVSAYSPGPITINPCPAVAVLDTWTSVYGGTASSPSGTKTVSAGSDSNRLLLVAVLNEYTGNVTNSWTVTYGGQTLTQVATVNNGYSNMWLGYLKESGLDAATSTTVSVTMTGNKSYSRVYAMVLDGVSQTTPVASPSGVYNSNSSGTQVATGNITWTANDRVVYAANSTSTSAGHGQPGTYTEAVENLSTLGGSAGYRTAVTGGGTEAVTVTHASGRSAIIGVAVKGACN
ncbi:MAG: hypothetical protein AB1634_00405 [Thermodesulfobacteriota bacterium]